MLFCVAVSFSVIFSKNSPPDCKLLPSSRYVFPNYSFKVHLVRHCCLLLMEFLIFVNASKDVMEVCLFADFTSSEISKTRSFWVWFVKCVKIYENREKLLVLEYRIYLVQNNLTNILNIYKPNVQNAWHSPPDIVSLHLLSKFIFFFQKIFFCSILYTNPVDKYFLALKCR